MKKILIFTFLYVIFLHCTAINNLNIHGFSSQGFCDSSYNNFLAKTKKGSFEFNETSINFAKYLNKDTKIGMQFLSRDTGDSGNNKFILDWGYADISRNSRAGLRIGRIKIPLGLHNAERDIDLLRNTIFLPQSVYNESMRSFILAINGFNYYNLINNNSNKLNYDIILGSVNIEKDNEFISDSFGVISSTVNLQQTLPLTASNPFPVIAPYNYTLSPEKGTNTKTIGGCIEYDIKNGLKLIYSNYSADVYYDAIGSSGYVFTTAGGAFSSLDGNVTVDMKVNENSVAGIEYEKNNLKLTYESNKWDVDLTMPVIGQFNKQFGGYYTQLDFRKDEKNAFSIFRSVYYPDLLDKSGTTRIILGQPEYGAYSIDNCYSYRYDVNEHTIFKTEYHKIKGTSNTLGGTEKYWDMLAFKVTISF